MMTKIALTSKKRRNPNSVQFPPLLDHHVRYMPTLVREYLTAGPYTEANKKNIQKEDTILSNQVQEQYVKMGKKKCDMCSMYNKIFLH